MKHNYIFVQNLGNDGKNWSEMIEELNKLEWIVRRKDYTYWSINQQLLTDPLIFPDCFLTTIEEAEQRLKLLQVEKKLGWR